MIDQNEMFDGPEPYRYEGHVSVSRSVSTLPFSRSNGTMLARLYERLTKRSRRRTWGHGVGGYLDDVEASYRQGVYDAYAALQEELYK